MVAVPYDFRDNPDLFWLCRKKRVVVRRTSLQPWLRLLKSGVIAAKFRLVGRALLKAGPCTGTELYEYALTNRMIPVSVKDDRAYMARELRKMQRMGYIIELDERLCTINKTPSGNPVPEIEWAVSYCPPMKPPKLSTRPSLKSLLPQAIEDMRLGFIILLAEEIRAKKSFKEAMKRYEGFAEVIYRIVKDEKL